MHSFKQCAIFRSRYSSQSLSLSIDLHPLILGMPLFKLMNKFPNLHLMDDSVNEVSHIVAYFSKKCFQAHSFISSLILMNAFAKFCCFFGFIVFGLPRSGCILISCRCGQLGVHGGTVAMTLSQIVRLGFGGTKPFHAHLFQFPGFLLDQRIYRTASMIPSTRKL